MKKKLNHNLKSKAEVHMYNILKLLKEKGELSTGNITHYLTIHYYSCLARLEDLEGQGKIVRVVKPRGNYWRLKK